MTKHSELYYAKHGYGLPGMAKLWAERTLSRMEEETRTTNRNPERYMLDSRYWGDGVTEYRWLYVSDFDGVPRYSLPTDFGAFYGTTFYDATREQAIAALVEAREQQARS